MYEWARSEFSKYISDVVSIHQTGSGNSQYGTMWICNIETKQNKKIKKDSIIEYGWVRGRNRWNEIERVKKRKDHDHIKKDEIIKKYKDMYDEFIHGDYRSLRDYANRSGCTVSFQTVANNFKKYVPEYSKNSKERYNFKESILQ